MYNEIVEFSNKLRESGLPVSIRSTKNAITAYELLDLGEDDNKILKDAFRSIYVKDKHDIPKFNDAYDDIFVVDDENEIDFSKSIFSGSTNRLASNRFLRKNKYTIKKGSGETKRTQPLSEAELNYLAGSPPLEEYNDLSRDSEILNRDLTRLNNFDPRVQELCQQLGRKIANKRSRRTKEQHSMKIDIRKTMRANLKNGGVPIDLVKVKPKPHKNEHIFLNDISGSCEWISSWFFMIMYAAQSAFKKSRTFEFDNKTIETTKALQEDDMISAFIKVKDKRIKNMMLHGSSDMYSAFTSFQNQVQLNRKSYVIMLSDCRDWAGPKVNRIPASVELVSEISRKSKRFIILNPEDRNKWDVVDSCVSLYQEAGAKVFEVRNLNQLAEFVMNM